MTKPVSEFTPRRAAKLLHLEQEERHRGTTDGCKQLIGRAILYKSPIDAIYTMTNGNFLELVTFEQFNVCIRDISCGTNLNQSAEFFLFTSFHFGYPLSLYSSCILRIAASAVFSAAMRYAFILLPA